MYFWKTRSSKIGNCENMRAENDQDLSGINILKNHEMQMSVFSYSFKNCDIGKQHDFFWNFPIQLKEWVNIFTN